LLFSMEPMVGRLILPHYGGAFYVWATTLMFFQGALLVGYAYAHAVEPRIGRLHLLVLLAPLAFLPFRAPLEGGEGAAALLVTLTFMCGVPFVALASTSVVAQRWLVSSRSATDKNPYPLYSASNAGSLVALLAYALVLEPAFGLRVQGWAWVVLYAAYVLCAFVAYQKTQPAALARTQRIERPRAQRLVLWVLLAAGPSALSMAATNLMIVEIGNAPVLWVLPLAAYLSSFILAFGRAGTPPLAIRILPVLVLAALTLYASAHGVADAWYTAGLILCLMFLICWATHGVLYETRPASEQLTWFYMALAVGGSLGGAFVALLAPRIFAHLHEYPVALLVCCGSVICVRKSWRMQRREWLLLGVATGAFVAVYFGTSLAAAPQKLLAQRRSPYGVYKVFEERGDRHTLRLDSGRTAHGRQIVRADASLDREPASYYHAAGPLGDVLRTLPSPKRIGVIGLGVGAIAGHLQAGDSIVFYEIDPMVAEIARTSFSYLQTPADLDIRFGDARRLLEQEERAGASPYSALVVDAFTGDGIPVHLLTSEALGTYLRRVESGAPVVLHISNRYVRLGPVVAAGAASLGSHAALRLRTQDLAANEDKSIYAAIGGIEKLGWQPLPADGPLWTDDHASLLPLWIRGWN
jgi:spermidine synthase